MADMIAVLVLLSLLGGAAHYLRREKKAGAKCLGCPHAKSCGRSACAPKAAEE